ncbi:MAG TPA: redoxin domain-containing protein [Gemmataceae bacterium]|jgi:peroxiredoxin|nr:redoxin domain-containing protein [Gemmataceae bacterium]
MRSSRLIAMLAAVVVTAAPARADRLVAMKIEAPEITDADDWINTKPLELKDLRGRVVVLHFWTFGCINCIHNYPCYRDWHKKYSGKGVTVIGIHTPETRAETVVARVRQKVKAHRLTYAIAVDGAAKIWNAWGNSFWPTTYLIDKKGYVRYRWDGELNWNKGRGEKIMRAKLEELLAEKD